MGLQSGSGGETCLEPLEPKEIVVCICGFDQAIGVQQKPIMVAQRLLQLFVTGVLDEAKQEPVLRDFVDSAILMG